MPTEIKFNDYNRIYKYNLNEWKKILSFHKKFIDYYHTAIDASSPKHKMLHKLVIKEGT